ncbi:MAG: LysM peptidoglycan-binding domain-containing protein [Herminiimonas sp.]|nr:LysM peptidoglycan-binding domain-containing protein [Herminiimonas sp.]
MKKFSTAALLVVSSAAFVLSSPAVHAATGDSALAGKTQCAFLQNAPDQHVVIKGDTLWGISGKFLEHAWCWPQVWGMNRDEIRNPHWIYPGQIVYFDRAAGRLRLGRPAGGGGGGTADVRLSPQIRIIGLDNDAIRSILPSEIEPFLSQPLVIEENEFKDTPRIVASQENHVFLGKDDKAYVRGDLKGGTNFQVFRPGKPLKDPVTKKIIGYEAVYLGDVKLVRTGKTPDEADSFVVTSSKEEMGVGDRLLPPPPRPLINYVPHAPERPVDGRVVSVYGGVNQAGQNQVVSVNRGAEDGLDIGAVLELSRFGVMIKDTTDDKKPVKLPDEKYGELFIFRTFKHISYGLVMQVRSPVQIGDVAKSPE